MSGDCLVDWLSDSHQFGADVLHPVYVSGVAKDVEIKAS
jgi:hypothetical protein